MVQASGLRVWVWISGGHGVTVGLVTSRPGMSLVAHLGQLKQAVLHGEHDDEVCRSTCLAPAFMLHLRSSPEYMMQFLRRNPTASERLSSVVSRMPASSWQ